MIGVIDYGAGNLRSVKKALDFLNVDSRIVRSAGEFEGLEKVILPGVGAFQAAIEKLQERNLFQKTRNWLLADKPFLGICLGMQVLFQSSEENPGISGLGVFKGTVPRFRHRKVPQIGWNRVRVERPSPLTGGVDDGAFFYFLHGYYVDPEDKSILVGTAQYGVSYPAIIGRGNLYAVQFHPEKSADNGLRLLKNWVEITC